MAIKARSVATANSNSVRTAKFNFKPYDQAHSPFFNNEENIDFVTYNGSLYVCVNNNTPFVSGDPTNNGFLLLVKKGSDGQRGVDGQPGPAGELPNIHVKFTGDQMEVWDQGGRLAVSDHLSGPAWVPELRNHTIVWKLDDSGRVPSNIDLDELRPTEEHPVIFRLNSDNTTRNDEEYGPGNLIQWKREGNEHWTNLMSISELMNLALAGVSFWEDENDGKLHFGHRAVLRANYDSRKLGNKKIADVELGDILFDAGEIPIYGYDVDIATINSRLDSIEERIRNIDFTGLATEEWVNNQGFLKNHQSLAGYATEGWVNNQGFLKQHQSLNDYATKSWVEGKGYIDNLNGVVKKVNGVTPNANGEVVIQVGSNVDLTGYATEEWVENKHYITNADVDLTGVVKSVTINDNTQTPDANGNVRFNIVLDGEYNLFDLAIEIVNGEKHLVKYINGERTDLGLIGGEGNFTDLRNIKLRFAVEDEQSVLQISYNGGDNWETIGILPEGGGVFNSDLYYTKTECDNLFVKKSELTGELEYYRTFMIYKRTNSSTQVPNLPLNVAAIWDLEHNELTLPEGYTEWKNNPDNATVETPYLWMTSAAFRSSDGARVEDWINPVCLTGENGDGEDGKGIEFIYHLGAHSPNIDKTVAYKEGESPKSNVSADWWNTEDSTDWLPGDGANGHWTDDPTGIDDTNEDTKIEWAAVRTSHYDENTKQSVWGPFSAPFRWSMWGEDGVDGAGVEYIFFVAAEDSVTNRQLNPAHFNGIPLTEEAVSALGASYQINDWVPDGSVRSGYQMPDLNWTDNPSDVGPDQPYEFVCIRKYNGETKKWGKFSQPALWGFYGTTTLETIIYGSTNNKPYTCYAFYRTNTDISNYTVEYDFSSFNANAYSDLTDAQKSEFYTNPLDFIKTKDSNNVVQQISWQDTVPSGTAQLWLITAHIGDEDSITDTGWTSPRKWGDNAGFQVEYAVADENTTAVYNGQRTLPSLNNYKDNSLETVDESSWRTAAATANCGQWGDDIEDPTYMATAYKKGNGDWSEWTIAKIKGEQGPAGDTGPQGPNGSPGADGKSVEFVYYRTSNENEIPGVHETQGSYDGSTPATEDPDRNDFLPKATSDGFTLKDGTYWHDHPSGVTEELQCEWVGIRTSDPYVSNNDGVVHNNWGSFNIALWSKWGKNGRDGDGIEYIFCRSNSNVFNDVFGTGNGKIINPATISVDDNGANSKDGYDFQDKVHEYIPTGWSDDAAGVDADHKFEWMSKRKYQSSANGGAWEAFSTPKIWANFSKDGESSYVIEGPTLFTFSADSDGNLTNNNEQASGSYTLKYGTETISASWSINIAGVSFSSNNISGKPSTFTSDRVSGLITAKVNNIAIATLPVIFQKVRKGATVAPTNQVRYYKANSAATGVTAPSKTTDPTTDGWSTSSNNIVLSDDAKFLWMFERIIYSNGDVWQSSPVIIRYFNAEVQVDYNEIENRVLNDIDDTLQGLNTRLGKIVNTDGDVIVDGENGLVKIITNYIDPESGDKSFADVIADAASAKINQNVGSAIGKTLTAVGQELDGIDGKITTAATQAKDDAIQDARQEINAAEARITSTVTKARYVWVNNEDGSIVKYEGSNPETDTKEGYTLKLVSEAMSAIQQEADKISLIVGEDGNAKADIIVDAINGGTVSIDANHIELNGEVIANAVRSSQVDITDDEGYSTVILSKNGIDVRAGSLGGGNGVSITSDGVVLGSDCTISYDNISDTPDLSGLYDNNGVLKTFITRDSLTTNKITGNEIAANTIDADHIKAGAITADNIVVGGGDTTPLKDYIDEQIEEVTIDSSRLYVNSSNDYQPVSIDADGKTTSNQYYWTRLVGYNGTSTVGISKTYYNNGDEIDPWVSLENYDRFSPLNVGFGNIYLDDLDDINGYYLRYRCAASTTFGTSPRTLSFKIELSGYATPVYFDWTLTPVESPVTYNIDTIGITQLILDENDNLKAADAQNDHVATTSYSIMDNNYNMLPRNSYVLFYSFNNTTYTRMVRTDASSSNAYVLHFTNEGSSVVADNSWDNLIRKDDWTDYNSYIVKAYLKDANDNGSYTYDNYKDNQVLDWEETPILRDGATGEKGEKGDKGDTGAQGPAGTSAVPYMNQGVWESGKTYVKNDQQVDVVKHGNSWWMCNVASSTRPSFTASDWTQFAGSFSNIATGLLVADDAVIQNLKVAEVATALTGKRITINQGGAAENGGGNNSILGFASGAEDPGITISGDPIPENIFNVSNTYHYLNGELVISADTGNEDVYLNSGTFTTNGFTIRSGNSNFTINFAFYHLNGGQRESVLIDPQYGLNGAEVKIIARNVSNNNDTVLARYVWNGSSYQRMYNSPDPDVTLSAGTYRLGFISSGGSWNDYTTINEQPYYEWLSVYENESVYVATVNGYIIDQAYTGTAKEGVTIGPNGILVYFDTNNYLQFSKTGSTIIAKWVSGNINLNR